MTQEYNYSDIINKTYPEGLRPRAGDLVTRPETGDEYYIDEIVNYVPILVPIGNTRNTLTEEFRSPNNLPALTHKPDIYIDTRKIHTATVGGYQISLGYSISFSSEVLVGGNTKRIRLFLETKTGSVSLISVLENGQLVDSISSDSPVENIVYRYTDSGSLKWAVTAYVNRPLVTSDVVTLMAYDEQDIPISAIPLNVTENTSSIIAYDGEESTDDYVVGIDIACPYLSPSDSSLLDMENLQNTVIQSSEFQIKMTYKSGTVELKDINTASYRIDGLADFLMNPGSFRGRIRAYIDLSFVNGREVSLERAYSIIKNQVITYVEEGEVVPETPTGLTWGPLYRGISIFGENITDRLLAGGSFIEEVDRTYAIAGIANSADGTLMTFTPNLGRGSVSYNGGVTWFELPPGLGSYSGSSGAHDQIVGGMGRTFIASLLSVGSSMITHDGGRLWTPLPGNYNYLNVATDSNGIWMNPYSGGYSISRDNGDTWEDVVTPRNNPFAISGLNGTWIMGAYRSDDDGDTWREMTPEENVGMSFVRTDYIESSSVSDGNGVWMSPLMKRSLDNGLTWSDMDMPIMEYTRITTDRMGTWIVLGLIASALRIFHTADNGENWTELPNHLNTNYPGSDSPFTLTNIAPDFKGNWVAVGIGGTASRSPAIVSIAPSMPVRFKPLAMPQPYNCDYNGSKTWMAACGGSGLWRSTDNAQSYQPIVVKPNTSLNIVHVSFCEDVWLAIDYRGVFSNSPDSGIYRSVDNGENWTQVLSSPVIMSASGSPKFPRVLYGPSKWITMPSNLFYSVDKGLTWKTANTGDIGGIAGFYPSAGKASTKGTYVMAGHYGAIIVSRDGGTNWKFIKPTPVPYVEKLDLWESGSYYGSRGVDTNNDGIWMVTTNREVYRSLDDGETWHSLASGLGVVSTVSKYENVRYVSGSEWIVSNLIDPCVRTLDNGETWDYIRPMMYATDIIKTPDNTLMTVGAYTYSSGPSSGPSPRVASSKNVPKTTIVRTPPVIGPLTRAPVNFNTNSPGNVPLPRGFVPKKIYKGNLLASDDGQYLYGGVNGTTWSVIDMPDGEVVSFSFDIYVFMESGNVYYIDKLYPHAKLFPLSPVSPGGPSVIRDAGAAFDPGYISPTMFVGDDSVFNSGSAYDNRTLGNTVIPAGVSFISVAQTPTPTIIGLTSNSLLWYGVFGDNGYTVSLLSEVPIRQNLKCITADTSGIWMIVGTNGCIVSLNDGEDWIDRSSLMPAGNYTSVITDNQGRFCAITDSGMVVTTINEGLDWVLLNPPGIAGYGSGIYNRNTSSWMFTDGRSESVLTYPAYTPVWNSTLEWSATVPDLQGADVSLYETSGAVHIVILTNGSAYRSTNSGLTWAALPNYLTGTPVTFISLTCTKSSKWFALDDVGNIRMSTNNGSTWVQWWGGAGMLDLKAVNANVLIGVFYNRIVKLFINEKVSQTRYTDPSPVITQRPKILARTIGSYSRVVGMSVKHLESTDLAGSYTSKPARVVSGYDPLRWAVGPYNSSAALSIDINNTVYLHNMSSNTAPTLLQPSVIFTAEELGRGAHAVDVGSKNNWLYILTNEGDIKIRDYFSNVTWDTLTFSSPVTKILFSDQAMMAIMANGSVSLSPPPSAPALVVDELAPATYVNDPDPTPTPSGPLPADPGIFTPMNPADGQVLTSPPPMVIVPIASRPLEEREIDWNPLSISYSNGGYVTSNGEGTVVIHRHRTGTYIVSRDYGETWTSVTMTLGVHLYTSAEFICVGKNGVWMFAGYQSKGVFISRDDGVTWTFKEISFFQTGQGNTYTMLLIYSIVTDDEGTWFAFGQYNMFRSTDDGETWEVVIPIRTIAGSSNDDPQEAQTDGNGTWFSAGLYSMKTTNSGDYWQEPGFPEDTTYYGIGTDKKGVWILASTNFLSRSINNGATWTQIPGSPAGQRRVTTDGNGVWFSFSNGNTPYISRDHGLTWTPDFLGSGSGGPGTSAAYVGNDTWISCGYLATYSRIGKYV